MSSHILKQARTTGEQEAVPFKEWITSHANRIPQESVEIPPGEKEAHERPGYNYRQVIDRQKTRVANRQVSVGMLPSSYLNLEETSSHAKDPADEADEFPFGLTAEEFSELRANWEEEHQEHLEKQISEARADGYEEGYQAATEEVEEEIQALTSILTDATNRIESEWTDFFEEIEPLLGKLAFDIAERILDAPLPEEIYEGVTAAIHDAVDELSGEIRTDITIHPADFMRIKESGLLEQLENAYDSLHWHSDPELEQRGDWIVETPKAAIRHLQEELLQDVERTLELP